MIVVQPLFLYERLLLAKMLHEVKMYVCTRIPRTYTEAATYLPHR